MGVERIEDSTDATFASSVEIVAGDIDGILRNCGLSLATAEQGLYIGVGVPCQCTISPYC